MNQALSPKDPKYLYIRRTPHPVIVVYEEYKRTLIYSFLSHIVTITGWGVHLDLAYTGRKLGV